MSGRVQESTRGSRRELKGPGGFEGIKCCLEVSRIILEGPGGYRRVQEGTGGSRRFQEDHGGSGRVQEGLLKIYT